MTCPPSEALGSPLAGLCHVSQAGKTSGDARLDLLPPTHFSLPPWPVSVKLLPWSPSQKVGQPSPTLGFLPDGQPRQPIPSQGTLANSWPDLHLLHLWGTLSPPASLPFPSGLAHKTVPRSVAALQQSQQGGYRFPGP